MRIDSVPGANPVSKILCSWMGDRGHHHAGTCTVASERGPTQAVDSGQWARKEKHEVAHRQSVNLCVSEIASWGIKWQCESEGRLKDRPHIGPPRFVLSFT